MRLPCDDAKLEYTPTNSRKRVNTSKEEEEEEEEEIAKNSSYKEVGPIKDLSYGVPVVKRIVATITIPRNRTEEEVINTLKRAAKEIAKREKPDALAVKAFAEGENVSYGTYTAGEAVYAPNGKWEDAALSAPFSISVTLGKVYFQDNKNSLKKGDSFILVSNSNEPIDISSQRNSSYENEIIAKLPVGSTGVILDKYVKLSPYVKITRYLIKSGDIQGWVYSDNVSYFEKKTAGKKTKTKATKHSNKQPEAKPKHESVSVKKEIDPAKKKHSERLERKAKESLRLIKRYLIDKDNKKAKEKLQGLIEKYPNGETAKEAAKILKNMEILERISK